MLSDHSSRPALVLSFVNQLRRDFGIGSPLERLPQGTHSGYSCPIACALEVGSDGSPVAYVSAISVRVSGAPPVELPTPVASWVRDFDAGEYPEFEAEVNASGNER